MRRAESRFALRALAALLVATAAWGVLSPAYLAVLRVVATLAGSAVGAAVHRGPAGASPWLIPAVALLAASVARPRRIVLALTSLITASLLADAVLVVVATASGLAPSTADIVYQAAAALIPLAAVVIFTGGRPDALWERLPGDAHAAG